MKKIIFLLLVSGAIYADGFYSAGSFSYDPINTMAEADGTFFRTSVTVGAQFSLFYAEAEQNTDMVKSDLHMFSPYNSEYYVRAGAIYNGVYAEYEHLCVHGVDTYNPQGGYDRVTIGFDTRLMRQNAKNKDP